MVRCLHRLSALVAVLAGAAPDLPAQCGTQWQAEGLGLHGVDGPVTAMTWWDPDGPGPAAARLVVGGRFTTAGSVVARGLATFDFATETWSEIGGGIGHATLAAEVHALAIAANGDLLVAGVFDAAGASAAANIARWNGWTWSPLGSGTDGAVQCLCVLANGDVIAGGAFTTAGSQMANRIARWNGTAWQAMGTGCDATVLTLARRPNGDLVAGGRFTTMNGLLANHLARWDGATWHAFGTGVATLPLTSGTRAVNSLATLANGDLVVGGRMDFIDGVAATNIARWDGSSWHSLGTGTDPVDALAQLPQGDVVASCAPQLSSNGSAVRQWNGASWQSIAVADTIASLLPLPTGGLALGGSFSQVLGAGTTSGASNIARWDQQQVLPLGGTGGAVLAATHTTTGSLVIAGDFERVEGVACAGVAMRSGSSWQPLGAGTDGPVHAVLAHPSGDLVVGGSFTQAGGAVASGIARWDGASWHGLAAGVNGAVHALARLPNGDVVAGGWFTSAGSIPVHHVARWDGVSWHALGNGLPTAFPADVPVTALLVRANGDLVAGGSFPGAVARWDGSAWQAMGGAWSGPFPWRPPAVYAFAETAGGDLVAGGSLRMGSWGTTNVVQWNGLGWQPLGAPFNDAVAALTTLPSGDLLAGGPFTAVGGFTNSVARWNGATWSNAGNTVEGWVATFTHADNGDVLVAGQGRNHQGSLLRLAPTCRALAPSSGTGCTGSGGANVLTATSLPWIGATFTATTTGMPGNGLALRVLGLNLASTPLATILPQGTPGCSLLVTPDQLDLYVPAGGSVVTSLAIPHTLALANQTLHQQVVAIELSALGAITALTSSNALTLTIGAF